MDGAKGGIKALENWAKRVTTGYQDVNVRDLSMSFRDGLAFCAIIHHYRPDLIDFESLSKANIFQNNSLAFSVAEKQLGVPALLDAEDMVKYDRPDKLSIITYLSQLHNCFENKNKVNSIKPGLKRIAVNNAIGPPVKVSVLQPTIVPLKRHEVCQVCKHRVYLLERLIVHGKLYHTTCFRCNKCNALLNPGAYVESDAPGLYECSVCLSDENMSSIDTTEEEQVDAVEFKGTDFPSSSPQSESLIIQNQTPAPQTTLSETVTRARSSFLQHSLSSKPTEAKFHTPEEKTEDDSSKILNSAKGETSRNGLSVRDKISVFESNGTPKLDQPSITTAAFTKNSIESGKLWLSVASNECSLESAANATSPDMTRTALPQSEVMSNKKSSEYVTNHSFPKVPNMDTSNFSGVNGVEKQSLLNRKQVTENDKTTCDSTAKYSILNKVPSVNAESSSKSTSSQQLDSTLKDLNTCRMPYMKQQSDINSYKSPLKGPRDIFQTNIQPLKLSIPSINSTSTKGSASLPITPITSPDSSKTGAIQIPQIMSTYSRTMSRPTSTGSLCSSSEMRNTSENNFFSAAQSNSDRTITRRSSLESSNKESASSSVAFSKSALMPNEHTHPVDSFSETEHTRSGTTANSDFIKAGDFNSIHKAEVKPEHRTNITFSQTENKGSSDATEGSSLPIPKVRHSLEMKNNYSRKSLDLKISSVDSSEYFNSDLDKETDLSTKATEKTSQKLYQTEKVPIISTSATKFDSKSASKDSVKIRFKADEGKDKDSGEVYPDDLNPFGDEEEDEEEYPEDLNPFGDDDDDVNAGASDVLVNDYDESKNPFASDEDESDIAPFQAKEISTPSPRSMLSQDRAPFQQNESYINTTSSPTGSLRGTMKKRLAPKPPKLSDIFPNDSADSDADTSIRSSSSASVRNLQTPSPKVRKSKPAPPPPPVPTGQQTSKADLAANSKHIKDMDNMKLKSSVSHTQDADNNETPKQWKKKKRPAPPVPIPMRKDAKKIPLKEIIREMKEIEEKQREYERQGRELELLIRDKDKDEEPSVEEEEYIMQLFELVNQKNALFRRQAELMYIKRSQRLEEQQFELEKQIRELMSKPESERTEEDKAKEDELILEFKDIVDQRNSIIDSIEMDRRRELEEDVSVQEQLEIKNGDLPITAEIKEKSSGKSKKTKHKKDKKKHQENGPNESGKNTLKKRKWLSKHS